MSLDEIWALCVGVRVQSALVKSRRLVPGALVEHVPDIDVRHPFCALISFDRDHDWDFSGDRRKILGRMSAFRGHGDHGHLRERERWSFPSSQVRLQGRACGENALGRQRVDQFVHGYSSAQICTGTPRRLAMFTVIDSPERGLSHHPDGNASKSSEW